MLWRGMRRDGFRTRHHWRQRRRGLEARFEHARRRFEARHLDRHAVHEP
jgi:hypothetical protein